MALKRKQYVVDKKFQLGTTFTIIGVIFLVVALIIGLIAFNATRNNHKLAEIVDVQDNIVQALIAHTSAIEAGKAAKTKAAAPQKNAAADDQIELRAIASDHYSNIEDMKKMVAYNTYFLVAVVVLVVIQGVVLFFVLILKTHRIAGPIYVMSMYMRQIRDGSIPDKLRPLRKKDEFKDFYSLFESMVDALRPAGKKTSSAKKAAKSSRR